MVAVFFSYAVATIVLFFVLTIMEYEKMENWTVGTYLLFFVLWPLILIAVIITLPLKKHNQNSKKEGE